MRFKITNIRETHRDIVLSMLTNIFGEIKSWKHSATNNELSVEITNLAFTYAGQTFEVVQDATET